MTQLSERTIPILAAALALPLAGCATSPLPATLDASSEPLLPALSTVPVYRISTPTNSGTAVHLGGDRLLTNRHVLTAPRIYVHDTGGRDWAQSRYEVLAQGSGGDGFQDDWALIDLLDLSLGGTETALGLAPEPALEPGTDVYLIGFPAEGQLTWDELLGTPKTIIKARVATLPPFTGTPSRPPIYLDAPRREIYSGLSGGPAVFHDPQDGRLKLAGIYKGGAAVWFLGLQVGSLHALVPLPAEVADIVGE
ncbi:MAG: S1 family peptidase [Planctomycetota bacterium]|jgi:hypothetical protein